MTKKKKEARKPKHPSHKNIIKHSAEKKTEHKNKRIIHTNKDDIDSEIKAVEEKLNLRAVEKEKHYEHEKHEDKKPLIKIGFDKDINKLDIHKANKHRHSVHHSSHHAHNSAGHHEQKSHLVHTKDNLGDSIHETKKYLVSESKPEKVADKIIKEKESFEALREFNPDNERKIAMDFAIKVHKKFDRIVKASILFGSQAKNKSTVGSDIDIILIIDDASINWDLELVSWYREELAKIIENMNNNYELHINSVKLTTWWQDLLHGDPVVINILRYGEGLIDIGGFFTPLKALLLQGKIKSTPEAVYAALQRAPMHLARSKASEMASIEGIYWTMVDSAQAALITAGKMPPSPEHIPQYLKESFVDTGMLKSGLVNAMRDIYNLHKLISHGSISDIKGAEIDKWQDIAEKFLSEMTRIINYLIEKKQ